MFLQIDSKCINDILNLKGYGYEVKKVSCMKKKVGQYSQYCPTKDDFNYSIFLVTKISTKV